MLPFLDLAVTLGGLIIPPAFDIIKKVFVKSENDTPERTMGNLATTKPEVVADYVKAYAELKRADTDFFNRDVCGTPSRWVVNLRAAIRPLGVIFAFATLAWMVYLVITGGYGTVEAQTGGEVLTGVRLSCEGMVSSWFGNRISITK